MDGVKLTNKDDLQNEKVNKNQTFWSNIYNNVMDDQQLEQVKITEKPKLNSKQFFTNSPSPRCINWSRTELEDGVSSE